MIQLTDKAIQKLKDILEEEGLEKHFIRVKISSGGCSGFYNDISVVPKMLETDELLEIDTLKVIIDPISLQYLDEATIDYSSGLMDMEFKFLNPKSTGSCGCKKSISF